MAWFLPSESPWQPRCYQRRQLLKGDVTTEAESISGPAHTTTVVSRLPIFSQLRAWRSFPSPRPFASALDFQFALLPARAHPCRGAGQEDFPRFQGTTPKQSYAVAKRKTVNLPPGRFIQQQLCAAWPHTPSMDNRIIYQV